MFVLQTHIYIWWLVFFDTLRLTPSHEARPCWSPVHCWPRCRKLRWGNERRRTIHAVSLLQLCYDGRHPDLIMHLSSFRPSTPPNRGVWTCIAEVRVLKIAPFAGSGFFILDFSFVHNVPPWVALFCVTHWQAMVAKLSSDWQDLGISQFAIFFP